MLIVYYLFIVLRFLHISFGAAAYNVHSYLLYGDKTAEFITTEHLISNSPLSSGYTPFSK